MNLELIRKYETEFLHMLHGGTLLGRVMTSDEDDEMYTIWYKVDDKVLALEKWTSDYLFRLSDKECEYYKPQFIINDEYVDFRKALAEGRTVQYMNSNGEIKSLDDWDNIGWKKFKGCVENYRIKPNEPKFKVGDYVRYIHTNSPKPLRISNINCERYYFENAGIILRIDEIEKWEPKEDEVCIFWDIDNMGAVIAKLLCITAAGKYRTEHNYWDNCMPFTGILPPHMKD